MLFRFAQAAFLLGKVSTQMPRRALQRRGVPRGRHWAITAKARQNCVGLLSHLP